MRRVNKHITRARGLLLRQHLKALGALPESLARAEGQPQADSSVTISQGNEKFNSIRKAINDLEPVQSDCSK